MSTACAADEDDVVEVIASHYLAAYALAPDAEDAAETKDKARMTLAQAGDRAESLAAAAEAKRYFEQASELTDDPTERAALLDRAGEMAARAGDPDGARNLFEESITLHEAQGDAHAAARVLLRLGRVDSRTGRRAEALARGERAFSVISEDEPDEDLALLAARLSLDYWFTGDLERASERVELALDIAEAHGYPEALAIALRAKTGVVHSRGHANEAEALLKRGLEIALEHDLWDEAVTAYFWLSDRCFMRDAYADALGYQDESLALARKRGHRPYEWAILAEQTYPLTMLGRWDEALAMSEEFTQEQVDAGGVMLSLLDSAVQIHVQQGDVDRALRVFSMFSRLEHSTDVQERAGYLASRASLHLADARPQEGLADGEAAVETMRTFGMSAQSAKHGIVTAIEAAFTLGDTAKLEELLTSIETLPRGTRPPYLDAQAKRFRARLGGDPAGYAAAAAGFRDLSLPFWLAVTQLEHGELTGDASLLAEAREIFERLEARPWLERLDAVAPTRTEVRA